MFRSYLHTIRKDSHDDAVTHVDDTKSPHRDVLCPHAVSYAKMMGVIRGITQCSLERSIRLDRVESCLSDEVFDCCIVVVTPF